jgi:hypothetical protein
MHSVVDYNLILNAVALVLLVVAVPRALKATKHKAELVAKDTIIHTREQTNDSLSDRIGALDAEKESLTHDLEAARIASKRCEVEAGQWKARYEEQSRYTAEQALTTIERLIEAGDSEAKRRHTEIMGALGNVSVLVGDRRSDSRRADDDEPLAAQ